MIDAGTLLATLGRVGSGAYQATLGRLLHGDPGSNMGYATGTFTELNTVTSSWVPT